VVWKKNIKNVFRSTLLYCLIFVYIKNIFPIRTKNPKHGKEQY